MAILPTSPRQDRGGVRTAADLERKYDLAAILGMKKAILLNEQQLTKTNKILEDFVKSTLGTLENMQSQIDGNITTWFDYGQPTLTTYPANEWITDEMKINHIGDLYYDRNTGYAYRYENTKDGTYSWEKIKDNDVVEALAIANAAADTADSKRRVFVAKPVPPYDSGDLWFTSEGEIYICQISKDSEQVYADKDFIVATKYTDDTYAKKVGQELTVVKGTVTTIKEGMDEFSVEISVLENDILLAQTQIEANTEEIELRVTKDGIIGAINVSSEEILIDAKKINLVGAVTAECIDVDDLSAFKAKLGGWNIKPSGISKNFPQPSQNTYGKEISASYYGNYLNFRTVTKAVTGLIGTEFDYWGTRFVNNGGMGIKYGALGVSVAPSKDALSNEAYELVLGFSEGNVWAKKLSADAIACNGDAYIQNVYGETVKGGKVITTSGVDLDKINSNLFKTADYNIKLTKLSWIKTQAGKYYANYSISTLNASKVLSVMMTDWASLRESDNITASADENNIIIGSNVNTFIADSASVYVRVHYV